MSEVDINYELKMLKMMLNTYLDETVSVTEEGLEFLEAKCDQVVWKLATKIYSQSGYKVEFCTARDVVNSRIGVMKLQLAQARQAAVVARQAAVVADQIAKEKARQAAVVARQAAIVADQIAREKARQAAVVACRVAEEKARQAAEEEARFREQMTRILGELAGDEGFVRVFVKVRKIVAEQLSVEENKVNLDSYFESDLGADDIEAVELIMALEEEFDIEIPDEVAQGIYNVKSAVAFIYAKLSE